MVQFPRGKAPEVALVGNPAIRRKGDLASVLEKSFPSRPARSENPWLIVEAQVFEAYVSFFGQGQERGAEAEILDKHRLDKASRERLEWLITPNTLKERPHQESEDPFKINGLCFFEWVFYRRFGSKEQYPGYVSGDS